MVYYVTVHECLAQIIILWDEQHRHAAPLYPQVDVTLLHSGPAHISSNVCDWGSHALWLSSFAGVARARR